MVNLPPGVDPASQDKEKCGEYCWDTWEENAVERVLGIRLLRVD